MREPVSQQLDRSARICALEQATSMGMVSGRHPAQEKPDAHRAVLAPCLGKAGARGDPSVIASVQDLGTRCTDIIEEKHAYETA
jgi:hypothetical protein